jgi:excisionase family DNA binding protein
MLRDDWLNVADAARLLGIDRTTFYKWLKAGKLEHVRRVQPGGKGRVLYNRADLIKLFNAE